MSHDNSTTCLSKCYMCCVRLPDLICTQTKRVFKTAPAGLENSAGTACRLTSARKNRRSIWIIRILISWGERVVRVWTRSDCKLLTHSVIVLTVMWASPGWYKHKTDDVCARALFFQSEIVFTCWGCVCPEAKGVSLAMCAQDDCSTFLSRLLLSMKQLNAKRTVATHQNTFR